MSCFISRTQKHLWELAKTWTMVYAVISKLFAKYLNKESIVYLVPVSSHGHSWNEVVGFLFGCKGAHSEKIISLNRRSYTIILGINLSLTLHLYLMTSPAPCCYIMIFAFAGSCFTCRHWTIHPKMTFFFLTAGGNGLCWPRDLKDSKVMCSRVKWTSHHWTQEVPGLFLISPSYIFICKHPPPNSKCQREYFSPAVPLLVFLNSTPKDNQSFQ